MELLIPFDAGSGSQLLPHQDIGMDSYWNPSWDGHIDIFG